MKRRDVIKYLFITGSSVWLLPACTNETANTEGRFLNTSQQDLLEDLAETIIPSTNTPGTKALGLHHFINKMMLDCRNPDDQKIFKAGLNKFEDFIKKQKGISWVKLNATEKQEMLNDIVSDRKADEDIRACIKSIRELTVTGYRNSEYYLTKVQGYKIIPGHFYGCVKVNDKAL
ncbi:MAG: gluconate 2-dehydrogenase subunit 3 family protein [Niabella sp.]